MPSARRALRRFALILLALALVWPASMFADPANGADPAAQLGGEAFRPADLDAMGVTLDELGQAPADLTLDRAIPQHPKLSYELALLLPESRLSTRQAQDRATNLRFHNGCVQIHATPAGGQDAACRVLAALGAEVTFRSRIDGRIQAWLPVSALAAAADSGAIAYLQAPAQLTMLESPSGSSEPSQGVAYSNADQWHAWGNTGAGVKVAIIDGGFGGYRGLLGTHLPRSVVAPNFCDGETDADVGSGDPHGASCAEIVHDMAPDAQLYLCKIGTYLDLEEAVTWLRGEGVDVISTSIGWTCVTVGDGTGFFAELATLARDDGIFWASAAGNEAQNHWIGPAEDPDGDGALNINFSQEVNMYANKWGTPVLVPAGYHLIVGARWDDWDTPDEDLELRLLRWNGTTWVTEAVSDNPQTGAPGQEPVEFAGIVTYGAETMYGYVLLHNGGELPTTVDVYNPSAPTPLDRNHNMASIIDLGDAPDLVSVAALRKAGTGFEREDYSARGPLKGPGGAFDGGLPKPDLAGYAGVNTASSDDAFSGTSAATPHVSGAAALVLGAWPDYTVDELEAFLFDRAIPKATHDYETQWGYGRVYLGEPPNYVTDTPTTAPSATITPTPTDTPTPTRTATPSVTPSLWITMPPTPTLGPLYLPMLRCGAPATPTLTPTLTWTPSPTSTVTPTPTSTNTLTPQATLATPTVAPPTATPTAPTATASSTPQETLPPPTATPTASPTTEDAPVEATATPTGAPQPGDDVTVSCIVPDTGCDGYWDGALHLDGDMLHNNLCGPGADVMLSWVFGAVDVPQGATILSAEVRLYGYGLGRATTCLIDAYAEDSARPLLMAGIVDRPLVGEPVRWAHTWPASYGWHGTSDLTALVQAVVERPGWAAGNRLGLVVRPDGAQSSRWGAPDVSAGRQPEWPQGHGVTLTITYRGQ